MLLAARDEAALAATAAELRAAGGDVTHVAVDVPAPRAARRWRRSPSSGSAASTCCAPTPASSRERPLAEMTEADLDEVLGVNVKGTFFAVRPACPRWTASGHGRVVADLLDHRADHRLPRLVALRRQQGGPARLPAHRRDRAGPHGHHRQRGAARQHAHRGPGRHGRGLPGRDGPASIPLGRLGTVDDIGHAALFLATAEAGYITGQTIVVDGGQVLPESLEALTP